MATQTENISYKDAVDEIQNIFTEMDENEMDLDDFANKLQRAIFLINYCKQKLSGTKEEVEKMLKEYDLSVNK
ncbi:MAG: exodeoxyribonuclease VII small subunit [Marinilabiliaceae bacterium]|nr:exodeoxyribonuclease VII small subunit [Marinilabiliaceae bacterium]